MDHFLKSIDHLVFATPDFQAGVAEVEQRLGVRPSPGGRHPQWGTRNALLSLGGDTYFEVIGPEEGVRLPTAFQLDRVTRPRLVTWAVKCEDLDGVAGRAADAGIQLGEVTAGSRKTPAGELLSWRFTDPLTVLADGLVPFLIDWGETRNPARSAAPGCTLLHLRAEHPRPERLAAMLAALDIDLPLTKGEKPRLIATIRTPQGEIEVA